MFGWFSPANHGKPVRRQLERARSIEIARCVDGERQRITGTVEGPASLVSPITGRPCVYWMVTIDEVGLGGDWVERGATDRGVTFFVRDPSGIARVYPEGARTDLVATSALFSSSSALGAALFDLFTKLEVELNYPRTSKVRFTERIITTGARISVLGYNQHEPMQVAAATDVDAAGYRGDLPMRPVFSSSRRKTLSIISA